MINRFINTNAKEGDKVIFVGDEGYSFELQYAKKKLEIGKEYTVAYTITSEFQATICLEESPVDDFDTYLFVDSDRINQYLIEYICDSHRYLGIGVEEAEHVLHIIKEHMSQEDIVSFVQDSLCVFRSSNKALEWFNDGEIMHMKNIDFEITKDMIGKDVIDVILENKENYIKINDMLHLTWWL